MTATCVTLIAHSRIISNRQYIPCSLYQTCLVHDTAMTNHLCLLLLFLTSTHITPISLPFLGAFFLFLFYYASNTYFSFLLLKISVNYWRTRVTSARLHNDVDIALTKQHPFALLPPTAMVKKSRPFRLTLSCVKMTVLCPSGPATTSSSLIKIRQDHINAERQINDEIRSKLLYTHFLTIADWILDKRLTMLTEVSLETGMGFSEMEDEGFAPSRDYDDGSPKPASPKESDWDSDASNEERDPQSQKYHKASNIYSAYARLRLYNKYDIRPVMTILLIFFSALEVTAMINGPARRTMPTCMWLGTCSFPLSSSIIWNGSTIASSTWRTINLPPAIS